MYFLLAFFLFLGHSSCCHLRAFAPAVLSVPVFVAPCSHLRHGPVSTSRKPPTLLPTPLQHIILLYFLHCVYHYLTDYLCVHVWTYCLTWASPSPSPCPMESLEQPGNDHRSPLYPQHPKLCLALHMYVWHE